MCIYNIYINYNRRIVLICHSIGLYRIFALEIFHVSEDTAYLIYAIIDQAALSQRYVSSYMIRWKCYIPEITMSHTQLSYTM